MAVQKSNLPINFAKGLDLKSDPFQVAPGNFLTLQNTVFTKAGLLAKRNGFQALSLLPDNTNSYLTTFAGNLTAIGSHLNAYSQANSSWINKGNVNPMSVATLPLIRNNVSQVQVDSVTAPNGLVCVVYNESNGTTSTSKYAILDSTTGQNITPPVVIPVTSGTPMGGGKVFLLGTRFIVVFNNVISGTTHLQYIAISTDNPASVTVNADLASAITTTGVMGWDCVVAGSNMYYAYNTTSGGQSVKISYLTSILTQATPVTLAASHASIVSMCADTTSATTPNIYLSFYDNITGNSQTACYSATLGVVHALTTITTSESVANLTTAATNGVMTFFYEISNAYSFDSTLLTNYVKRNTITQAGTVGTAVVSVRSAGLASKCFSYSGSLYYLSVQGSLYQPTYFLINGSISTSAAPCVVAKLAYGNGSGYYTLGLPNTSLIGNAVSIPYLYKDLIQAVNKNTNVPAGSQVAGIYSQTGINLTTLTFTSATVDTAEIGNNLHLSGGILNMYDGYTPVEHGFSLWPELPLSADNTYHGLTPTLSAGALAPQTYFYQFTYEWTDNQGNAFKSAPSVPISIDLSKAATPTTFTSAFLSGTSTITVSSTANLYVGQKLTDTTTGGNLATNTLIAAVNPVSNQITLSTPTLGNSSVSGDTINAAITPVTTTATFAANASKITVASTTGFAVGQVITDTTTPANFQANTAITSIDSVNNIIGISLPTVAAGTTNTITTNNVISNTIIVPTYRITSKTANPVKIVGYRWSTAQQVYYQFTSIIKPVLNDTTVDTVTVIDTLSDAAILGNNIIYTTGGVVENIAAPACNIMTLFDTRLWVVTAEDPNLLWFSKQVIENTPAEMSDLFTIYIAPTAGSQGSTGPITALSVLDDKMVIFKNNALYYLNGAGPDNTGANNQYGEPVFITSTVGCTNPSSIVFMPSGLMFQSDKGIWLLDRNLNTTYIGAPVESLTQNATVVSALNIPGTNQVRFTLSSGVTLMYDYFYQQWGSFTGINAQSSTVYQGLHTFISASGTAYQELACSYLDGANPVLINFTTGWYSLAGLQGFERAYFFYLLGTYISPHRLSVQIAYDFQPTPSQSIIIQPDNYAPAYGTDTLWGGTPSWGGTDSLEQWRIFFNQQKCQSFQITITEIFDSTLGTVSGAGFTLSGINLIAGVKRGFTTLKPSRSAG